MVDRPFMAEAVSKRATSTSSAKVDPPERSVSASRYFGKGKVIPENRVVSSFDTASTNSGHSVHKGAPREAFIKEFLEAHLPSTLATGSGELIDSESQPAAPRRQFDLVIYKRSLPKLDFGGGISSFLTILTPGKRPAGRFNFIRPFESGDPLCAEQVGGPHTLLTRYCDDGQLDTDSLPVERALHGVAIGRRNYLFAGADSGGERAAAIYSPLAP
jgi:hypothetical protein